MAELPEPADRSIVMWVNGNNVPVCSFVRVDSYASTAEPTRRWFDSCDHCAIGEDPWEWAALCRQMGIAWTGPYPLTPGERLPEVGRG